MTMVPNVQIKDAKKNNKNIQIQLGNHHSHIPIKRCIE